VFTYDNKVPVCLWISNNECKKVPCIVDERICGDTFLKVEKIGPLDFVVADIWMYNSNCVFACSTFRQRYDWLLKLLKRFTTYIEGLTIDLIHKSELGDIAIKGYEEHPEDILGKSGYFVSSQDVYDIVQLPTPDCYQVTGTNGFLRVPDLKTSVYLRSKGTNFKCKCIKHDDEFWDVIENIPDLEVNAHAT
jgi:hypothetical protein